MSSLLFAASSNEIYDVHYRKINRPVGFIQGFPQIPLSSISIAPKTSVGGPRRNSLTNTGINLNSSFNNTSLHHANALTYEYEDLNKEKEQYSKDLQNWKKAIYENRSEIFFIFPLPISLLVNLPTYTSKTLIKPRAQKINYNQRAPLPMTYLSLFNTFNQTSTLNILNERPKSPKLISPDKIEKNDEEEDEDQFKEYSEPNSGSDSEQNNDHQSNFVNNIDYIKDIEIPGPDYNSKFTNSKNSLEYIKVNDFCIEKPRFGTKLIPQEPFPEFFEDYDDFRDSLKSWAKVEEVTDDECQHPSSFWDALNGRNRLDNQNEEEEEEQTETETDKPNKTSKPKQKKNILKKPERKAKTKIFTSVLFNYLKNPTASMHNTQNKTEEEDEGNGYKNAETDDDNSEYDKSDSNSILKQDNETPGKRTKNVTFHNSLFEDEQALMFKEALTALFSLINKAGVKRHHQNLPSVPNAQIIINEFKAGSPHCHDYSSAIKEVSNYKDINIKNYPELGQEPIMKYSLSVQDNIRYELLSVTESHVHRYDVFRLFLNALVGLNRYTMEMVIMFMAFPQITSNVADLFKCFGNLTHFNTQKFVGFNGRMSGSFNNLCQFLFEAQMLDAIERFFRKNEKVYHKNNPKFSSSLKKMYSSLKDQRKTVLESATKTLFERYKEIEEDFNLLDDYECKKEEVEDDEEDIFLKIKIFESPLFECPTKSEEIEGDTKVHPPLIFAVVHLLLNYLPKEAIQFFDKCKLHFLNWLLLLNFNERYHLGQICAHILCLAAQDMTFPQAIKMEFLELTSLKNDNFATRFAFPPICHLFCQLLTIDTKTVLPADRVTLLFASTLKLIEVQYDCAITLLESLCKIFKRRLKKKDSDYINVFDMFFDSLVVPFIVGKFSNEYIEERLLSSIFNLFPYIDGDHQESTFRQVFIPKFVSSDCDKSNVAWKVFRKHPSHASKFNSSKSLINAISQYIQDTHEKQITAKRHRISTIKPTLHRESSALSKSSHRNSPLIAPSSSSSILETGPNQPTPSIQFQPIVVSSSASHQMLPPLASNSSSPLSPLVELSPSEREEKVKTELLRKNLSIVSKMHLLLFICGYSEFKKSDRYYKSMRINQAAETNALLDDVKDAINKRIPEIYKFKNLAKSVMIAYRINNF